MNTVNPIRNNIAFTVFVSYKPPLLMCILKPIKAATRINTETANSQTDHFFIFNEPYAATRYKILLMKFAHTTGRRLQSRLETGLENQTETVLRPLL